LRLSYEDTGTLIPSGSIILQSLNAGRRLRFDDFKISRPLATSSHFQTSDWPSDYTRSILTGATLRTLSNNTFVSVEAGEVTPQLPAWPADMLVTCRLNVQANTPFEIRYRSSATGAYVFNFAVGQLRLYLEKANGERDLIRYYQNFFTPGRFFDFTVETLGNEIRVYDGDVIFADRVSTPPVAGEVKFTALESGKFFIDDCLYAPILKGGNEDGAWAFDRIRLIDAGLKRYLNDYWNEDFIPGEEQRTDDWWVDGSRAPGKFVRNADRTDKVHPAYLELSYTQDAAFRIFRDVLILFGKGQRADFFDSSDIFLTTDVRLPQAGTAWIAVRTKVSLAGTDLEGIRLEITRDSSDTYTVRARVRTTAINTVYYEGTIAAPDAASFGWVRLQIITYQNKAAFFVNGRYLTAALDVPVLSGTLALGVEADSIAQFSAMLVRDASIETR
jgi:hypothetical protein